MKQSAQLARHYGVHLHTHLAETEDEEQFCLQKFGYPPVGYMQAVDWVGEDVWFAHAVWVHDDEIQVLANHQVAYPLAAANVSRPLVSHLKSLHQPVVRARIRFSALHSRLLACL